VDANPLRIYQSLDGGTTWQETSRHIHRAMFRASKRDGWIDWKCDPLSIAFVTKWYEPGAMKELRMMIIHEKGTDDELPEIKASVGLESFHHFRSQEFIRTHVRFHECSENIQRY